MNISSLFQIEDISPSQFREFRKKVLLILLLSFSIFVFAGLGILNIIQRDFVHIWLDISGVVFLSIFLYLTKYRKMLSALSYLYVLLIAIIITDLFLKGGVENTGIMYIMLLPLPALFMLCLVRVLTVSLIFFSIIIYMLSKSYAWLPVYNGALVYRVLVIYITTTIITSVFVYIVRILEKNFLSAHEKLFKSREEYIKLATIREKMISVYTLDIRTQMGSIYNMTTLLEDKYTKMPDEKNENL
ncbi:MAG: hypothetical protein IPO21_19985 [Bacteroidales bacterium]|nr:hypothetical protein [Bacteroidales bacterium]